MKDFFKTLLASCFGVILAVVAIFVILGGIASAAVGLSGSTATASKGVLELKFDQFIPEETNNIEVSPFDVTNTNTIGLRDIKRLIANAKTDDNIKAISLQVQQTPNGASTLYDLTLALADFRKSGKKIYTYIDYATQNAYMLASVSDMIMLNPNGEIDIRGYGAMVPFIKGMTDKIGVDFNIFYAGDFKSATEPLRRTDMSPENKLQTREFLQDRYDVLKNIIFNNRKISADKMEAIIRNSSGRTAERALEADLVDKVGYKDEYEKIMAAISQTSEGKVNYISMKNYFRTATLTNPGSFSKKIAVVYAEGDISFGQKGKGMITDQEYIKILSKLRNDDKVKAVVLRVNSGGGSAFTSDVIWREVELLKKAGKPVVASFGDYAASGGYYIACGADKIFAAPNTLTGSIGVFSILPNFKKLMNDKVGITFDTVKTHPLSVFLSTNYDLSEREKELMTESTNIIYSQFLNRVAKGRKMSLDSVKAVAGGRVWTGTRGVKNGLVDKIGTLEDAIAEAGKLAKVDDFKIVEYPFITKELWEELFENLMAPTSTEDASLKTIAKLFNSKEGKSFKAVINMMNQKEVQARLPFMIIE